MSNSKTNRGSNHDRHGSGQDRDCGNGNSGGSGDNNTVPCFTPGSMILTETGQRPIETLRASDKVVTRDNGLQEIRWLGACHLSGDDLRARPALRPVRLPAGSLGNGLPERDMLVSPQHRMLLRNPELQMVFSESEMLVAATHLQGLHGIAPMLPEGVSYLHMMFDHHELVLADGAWSESFQPGAHVIGALDAPQRDEILTLFPELEGPRPEMAYPAARASLKGREAILAREMM